MLKCLPLAYERSIQDIQEHSYDPKVLVLVVCEISTNYTQRLRAWNIA